MGVELDKNAAVAQEEGEPDRLIALAWAGWSLNMPSDWQPLKLLGTQQKGSVIVGNDTVAIFSLHWERLEDPRGHKGDVWVAQRLAKLGGKGDAHPPSQRYFTACGWAHAVETEQGKETTYWYGFSATAGLLLGVKVNGFLAADLRERVVQEVLPSLRTTPRDQETLWSLYALGFASPTQYELAQRHLYSGDVALEFGHGRQDALLLRQIYPGDLALMRRPFDRWLEMRPFKEHRRLRRRTVRTESWRHGQRAHLSGIVRHGRKQLGVPLGWCAPRWSCAMAVHDTRLNRLLIAEHLSARAADQRICERAIEQMNTGI